eukprot:10700597-Ditylum_brightwellii.AAC.1
MSLDNDICIDNSDDDVAGSVQPSEVPSAPAQCWKGVVADMVKAKTKDTVDAFFTLDADKNPSPEVKKIVTELLSQMQIRDKTAENKKAAKCECIVDMNELVFNVHEN